MILSVNLFLSHLLLLHPLLVLRSSSSNNNNNNNALVQRLNACDLKQERWKTTHFFVFKRSARSSGEQTFKRRKKKFECVWLDKTKKTKIRN
jgi:hypothetical protein